MYAHRENVITRVKRFESYYMKIDDVDVQKLRPEIIS